MNIIFLTKKEIQHIHMRVIEEFGGDQGVRDPGLLESAISIPQATFLGEYLHKDIPEMAAAYHFHLCMNHPFLDGNKRVAVVSAETFLLMNGWELNASDRSVEQITLNLARSKASKFEIVDFYRANSFRVDE